MKKNWGVITATVDADGCDSLLGALSIILNIDGVEELPIGDGKLKMIIYTRDLEKLTALNLGRDIKVETIEYDPSIETEWKKYFKTQRVGDKIVIKPSWEAYEAKPGDVVVTIDPGTAFGTGLHGTTKGVLMSLQKIIADIKSHNNASLLDAGTGSGILAIAAYKLGIKNITAIDNDIEAVNIAKENFLLNDIPLDMIEISQRELADEKKQYDVVLANILADVMIQEKEQLSLLVKPSGYIIMSGILIKEEKKVIDALSMVHGLNLVDKLPIDEWSTITYKNN